MAGGLPYIICACWRASRRSGVVMKDGKKEFTLLECGMVVTILLFVAAIAIQDLVHSVRMSEENTVHAAATEYSALRNTYAGQYRAVPADAPGVNSASATNVFVTPAR